MADLELSSIEEIVAEIHKRYPTCVVITNGPSKIKAEEVDEHTIYYRGGHRLPRFGGVR